MQPEALIAALKAVRTLYDGDRCTADDRLAALIEQLRVLSAEFRA